MENTENMPVYPSCSGIFIETLAMIAIFYGVLTYTVFGFLG